VSKSVSHFYIQRGFDGYLPDVVKFKLFMDEAEPVCPEKPLVVEAIIVCD